MLADQEPYSGTGYLFGDKVRIPYEIVPDIYVSDLYKEAKRAAKVLKRFFPKVLVFSVGLKKMHGVFADQEPYSGTGHLFSDKVRIRYEIVPDIYVSDLYNVAKRAAKVLKKFSPKVLVFSVGLKDLILGLSPLDVHKRIQAAVYKIFNKKLFPVCGYYIPVLLFKPLHWGLQLNVNVEERRLQLKQNVNMLNLLLARDFTLSRPQASTVSAGLSRAVTPTACQVGSAKMLSCLIRDLGGALHFLEPCSDIARSYNQSYHTFSIYDHLVK